MSGDCHKRIMEVFFTLSKSAQPSAIVFNIGYSYQKELSVLKQLFSIQKLITECNVCKECNLYFKHNFKLFDLFCLILK